MDDDGIIELYWQRSEEAVRETAVRYGSRCRGVAYNILGNSEDAEECVNDTYLRAWNAIPPVRPRQLGAWLCRITRNLALNRLAERRADKRGGGETALALEELADCVSGSEGTSYDEGEVAEAINAFLQHARPRDRQIFLRRYWYLEPVSQIAAACSLRESNVTTILYRMRCQLKEELARKGIWL